MPKSAPFGKSDEEKSQSWRRANCETARERIGKRQGAGAPRRAGRAASGREGREGRNPPAQNAAHQGKSAHRGVAGGGRDGFPAGIPNRRGFERELGRAIAYIQRYQASGALIVIDVDRLKPINDNFGHAAGDEVLKAIIAVLSRQIRSSDVIGRLGGDEFALLLWNLSETDAHAKAAAFEEDIDRLSFDLRRPHGCDRRLRGRRDSRAAFGSLEGVGGRRLRDVRPQGAAAPRSLTRTFRKSLHTLQPAEWHHDRTQAV